MHAKYLVYMTTIIIFFEFVVYNSCLENVIYTDLIRNINDPEHPLTLEELNVVEQGLIEVNPVCKL